jgi:hypothetical protein
MAIFKANPEKALQRDIDAAKANRDRLAAKLAECETAIVERRSTAQALARDGAEDGVLDKAETAVRSAQDRAATIAGAIADVDRQLTVLERTKAENADRKLRSETAAATELLAREVVDVAAAFDAAAAALADCAGRAVPNVFEATGLHHFAAICRAEVPAAADMVSKLLRAHAASVLDGTGPATLRAPEGPIEPVTWPPAVEEKQESAFKYEVIGRGPAYRLPVPREAGQ